MTARLRLGTRGSPLALVQAGEVRARLAGAAGLAESEIEIVIIRTSGDAIQDRALAQAGGKGLFTKELDTALIEGGIDLAVHSAKDLPTFLPQEIALAGFLPREDPRDVFISAFARSIDDLPQGATVGTASLRREALLRRRRPDLLVTLLRGNVETRLRKLANREIDATLLALAGLHRLGLADRATMILDLDAFPPAVGQGAIAITIRTGDARTTAMLTPILDAETGTALACERAFLRVLDGSCRTPIAGHARLERGEIRFHALVLRRDGTDAREMRVSAPPAEAAQLGETAGREIAARLPADFFEA